MSFSKHIETAIGWNNLDDWKPILFRDLTVEPICTPREYGGDEVFHEACRTIEIDHAFRILRKQRKGK